MKIKKDSIKVLINSVFLLLSLILIVSSCTSGGAIEISSDTDNNPLIKLNNPFGNSVSVFSPSTATGSIGIETDGVTEWIKGRPEKEKVDRQTTEYIWTLSQGQQFILSVTKNTGVYDLNLRVEDLDYAIFHLNINSSPDEYFTGIFERVVNGNQRLSWREDITTALNLRGERASMKLMPTTSAYCPFYISSENYSFFVHGTWPGVFDFCKEYNDAVMVAFEGPELKISVRVAETPKELVQAHSLETGPTFLPPDWALGPWRWRDEHFNNTTYYDGTGVKSPYNSDLTEDILLMKHYDIPATAYWIDRPWAKGYFGYEDFEFDTVKFPKPESMIKWVNSHGMELMLWIAPFVCGDQAKYAKEKGYDLIALTPDKRMPGVFPFQPTPGQQLPAMQGNTQSGTQQGGVTGTSPQRMRVNIFGGASSRPDVEGQMELIDFTNEEASKWWGENGPAKLAKMGVKGFKLDRADGEVELDSLNLFTASGKTYRENYNDYPRQFIKATYEAVKPVLQDDFILFPRGMYTGSSKYGAMWAGDIRGEPHAFRAAVIAMQRCAVMGYPLWGSDIGGYWGLNRETCMKWLGFGCFSPLMEVGPTENRGFWNITGTPSYDTAMIATWRLYSKTRMNLIPYIKELVIEASKEGTPVARPLFLEYPEQADSWKNWETYLLGKDILVSVIWEEGLFEKEVYLPEGETWIDAWNTDNEYPGGSYVTVKIKPYQIPLFIRKGSSLKLGDLNELYQESFLIASKKGNLTELEASEDW